MSDDPAEADDREASFRDAEEWLAEQGIERQPIRVTPEDESRTEVSQREARRLAQDSARQAPDRPPPPTPPDEREGDTPAPDSGAAAPDTEPPEETTGPSGRLEEDVTEAVAFVRRSTARTPQSEQRLAGKLRDRDYPQAVVEAALERCREQGIVDDEALAMALLDEGREKGHARRRIGRDLRKRGFTSETIEAALATMSREQEDAAALDLATERARRLSGEDTETAFRRIVRYLARRGYPEGLARRVTRQALFDDGGDERDAGR